MIGLTFDGTTLTAATLSDGGEIFASAEQIAPDTDYRAWLLAVCAVFIHAVKLEDALLVSMANNNFT